MRRLRFFLLMRMYGINILYSMKLDNILSKLMENEFVQFKSQRIPTDIEKEIDNQLDYLVQEGLIKEYSESHYAITEKGKFHLSKGGFSTQAKKEINSLLAFRMSLIALILSIISILKSLFF